jgi:Arc/MetJ-type ribon-helix-helix transcriptional regulator
VETDTLNTLVTRAIWRAGQLEAEGLSAAQTWAEVSVLEEELAKVLPVSESEGRIARRGAVSAALKAATILALQYWPTDTLPRKLRRPVSAGVSSRAAESVAPAGHDCRIAQLTMTRGGQGLFGFASIGDFA